MREIKNLMEKSTIEFQIKNQEISRKFGKIIMDIEFLLASTKIP